MSESEYTKIGIDCHHANVSREHIWTKHLGDKRYEVCNIPAFTNACSIDDIIECEPDDEGYPMFVKTLEKKRRNAILSYEVEEEEDLNRVQLGQRLGVFIRAAEEHDIKMERAVPGVISVAALVDSYDDDLAKLPDLAETAKIRIAAIEKS